MSPCPPSGPHPPTPLEQVVAFYRLMASFLIRLAMSGGGASLGMVALPLPEPAPEAFRCMPVGARVGGWVGGRLGGGRALELWFGRCLPARTTTEQGVVCVCWGGRCTPHSPQSPTSPTPRPPPLSPAANCCIRLL